MNSSKLSRERAARALCELESHPPDIKIDGKPMWMSYLPEVDAVLEADLNPEQWDQIREESRKKHVG